MTTTLNIENLAFSYGESELLHDINLHVEQGQIACLLGPSGCGKSTLLRLVAGFEQPTTGTITINNKQVATQSINVAPQHRQVGMLFQDLALFPHLTVKQNIAFGLHRLDKQAEKQRVDELLELCRLSDFNDRYPHQLSGGQCQRVALARAMAPKPHLILLDEPFSSVETGLQAELVHEVKAMLQADQSTVLWVTHSLDEAFNIADQMGILENGKLLQWSSPKNLYENPNNAEVVTFLNQDNLVAGKVIDNTQIKTPFGNVQVQIEDNLGLNQDVLITVNKRDILIDETANENATVTDVFYQGGGYLVSVKLNNQQVVQFHHFDELEIGNKISLILKEKTTRTVFAKK